MSVIIFVKKGETLSPAFVDAVQKTFKPKEIVQGFTLKQSQYFNRNDVVLVTDASMEKLRTLLALKDFSMMTKDQTANAIKFVEPKPAAPAKAAQQNPVPKKDPAPDGEAGQQDGDNADHANQ
jgi:hypothetical protein